MLFIVAKISMLAATYRHTIGLYTYDHGNKHEITRLNIKHKTRMVYFFVNKKLKMSPLQQHNHKGW